MSEEEKKDNVEYIKSEVVENKPVEQVKQEKSLYQRLIKPVSITAVILIAFLLGSAFTSCPEQAPCEVYDYTSLTNQNIELVNQYSNCTIDKAALQTEYNTLKDKNNQLKIDYMNAQVNKTKCDNINTNVACLTFIKQISRLENSLEDCYQMNETFNCTSIKKELNLCEEKLENITDMLD